MILKWNYSANKSFLLLLKFIWVISGEGKSKENALCCHSNKHSGQRGYLSKTKCTSKSFIKSRVGGAGLTPGGGENITVPNCTVLISALWMPWKSKSHLTRGIRVNKKNKVTRLADTVPCGFFLGLLSAGSSWLVFPRAYRSFLLVFRTIWLQNVNSGQGYLSTPRIIWFITLHHGGYP